MSSKKNNESNINNIIQQYQRTLPDNPGIYQMFNDKNQCLYVGKAKNLKKRVYSYTHLANHNIRIQKMILETSKMQHILTETEEESLILEADLIKNLSPKYNILLRDDKSFSYLEITSSQEYPKIRKIKTKHITKHDTLFGPIIYSQLPEETIKFVQKTFMLRVCSDHTFKNRIKPCIYFEIKRCSAPCTGLISKQKYRNNVDNAISVLSGNTNKLKQDLALQMEQASSQNNFEQAIYFRNQITMLNNFNTQYGIILPKPIDADFVWYYKIDNNICCQVFHFIAGRPRGTSIYFSYLGEGQLEQDFLMLFLMQFYKKRYSKFIYCKDTLPDNIPISQALHKIHNKKVYIKKLGGNLRFAADFMNKSTESALLSKINQSLIYQNNFVRIEKLLNMSSAIKSIEAYDNSHFQGSGMLGVMISCTNKGLSKENYRIFKLKNYTMNKQNDIGMMKEVMQRRLNLMKLPEDRPSLMIIDGGLAQMNAVKEVLTQNKITDIELIAIKKGLNRKLGLETIIMSDLTELNKEEHDSVFYFLLKLRDEAHRFAIYNQKLHNLKASTSSILDSIPGIGSKKKEALLSYFGSIKNIQQSNVSTISQVKGITKANALMILHWLNS